MSYNPSAGAGSGTVTSVAGAGTVSGLTLTGTVTTAGSLTLGGPLTVATADIQDGAVTLAKQADMATASVVYRKTAGSGAPEVQTLATLKTDLGLTGTNSGDQTITLTGNVTGSGTGSFATTIAAGAVTNAMLVNSAVTIAGTSTALGTAITLDTITGLASTGLIKRTGANTLAVAVSATDYAPATSGSAILKGNGSGGFSSAVASTDYAPATSGSAILKGNGSGGFSNAAAGTDYVAPDTQLTSLAALSYTGNASKFIRVNAGETDFELVTVAGGGDVTGDDTSTTAQNIVAYSGTGGKNITELTGTQGDILYHNGTNWAKLAAGTLGQFLNTNGSGANPSWGYGSVIHSSKSAGVTTTGANTTPVSVSGAVFTYAASAVYRIWVMGRLNSTAATTGAGIHFDLSSAVTAIDVQSFHQLASAGTLTGGHSIADDASVGVSSGVPAGPLDVPITAMGLLVTGANTGTCQLRLRSETTAVTELLAGTVMVVERVA